MGKKTKSKRNMEIPNENFDFVLTPSSQMDNIKANLHCKTCNISFPTEERSNKHYDSDFHKNYQDLHCSACSIHTATREQMWKHLKSAKHLNKSEELGVTIGSCSPFYQNLPRAIKDQMSFNTCLLCSDAFPTIKSALLHYQSSKHEAAGRRWFKEKRQSEKQAVNSSVLESKPDVNLQPDKPEENYICYLCDKLLASKLEKNEHVISYPHKDIITIKSLLVRQGIMQEFWSIRDSTVHCLICKAKLLTSKTLNAHINSNKHINKFSDWVWQSEKIALDVDAKLFYCKSCDKDLDGTSEADRHYSFKGHEKKMELYCPECEIGCDTLDLLELHKTSDLHLKKIGKFQAVKGLVIEEVIKNSSSTTKSNDVQINKADNKLLQNHSDLKEAAYLAPNESKEFNINITELKTSNDFGHSKETTNLKEEVFNELDKLIKKLYYSKTVPYDIALQYLKKVNKEVEEMAKKKEYFEVVSQEIPAKQEINNLSALNGPNCSLPNERHSFYPNYALSDINSINCTKSKNLEINNDAVSRDDLNIQEKPNIIPLPFNDNNVEYKNIESIDFQTLEKTSTIQPSTNHDKKSGKVEGITGLLNKIFQSKLKVGLEYEETIENELLNEMIIFLRQIDENEIPLETLSEYLQKCNNELESQDFTETKPIIDRENDCTHIQSDTDTKRIMYTREELFRLRTVETFGSISPQLRDVLNTECNWNQYFNDNKLKVADGCPISIYNYYNGDEFECFMDFYELYSQGSLDSLKKC